MDTAKKTTSTKKINLILSKICETQENLEQIKGLLIEMGASSVTLKTNLE